MAFRPSSGLSDVRAPGRLGREATPFDPLKTSTAICSSAFRSPSLGPKRLQILRNPSDHDGLFALVRRQSLKPLDHIRRKQT